MATSDGHLRHWSLISVTSDYYVLGTLRSSVSLHIAGAVSGVVSGMANDYDAAKVCSACIVELTDVRDVYLLQRFYHMWPY